MSEHQPIDLDDLQRVAVKVRELIDDNWLGDMVEIAAAEIARLREERRWVSVGERLPLNSRAVIANVPSAYGPQEASFRDGKWYDGFGVTRHPVTHWMPLPPGPEGDG